MELAGIDFGALSIPLFVTIWASGWGACLLIQVKPLRDRLERLETKQEENERAKDEEIRMLRQRAYGK